MSAPPLEPRGGGVYERAGWQEGTPGTYALVIGISDYTYLRGKQTYGLDKLFVSALTAYRFFKWLRDQFGYRGTPLMKCWLLLAPTPAELAVEPALASAGGPADFEDCEFALNEWFNSVKAVTDDPKQVSGSTFFFSGHGFQVTKQVLLPRDYLHPKRSSVNRAMSTANIYDALFYTNVKRHFLFVDACRNDTSKLRTADQIITGERILNVPLGVEAPRREGFEKILYASAEGEQTWQLDDVTKNEGMSFYGRALLNGLLKEQRDAHPHLPDKTQMPWAIPFDSLFQYMGRRLSVDLKPYNIIYQESPVVEDGARQTLQPPVVTHVPVSDVAVSGGGERIDTGRPVPKGVPDEVPDVETESLDVTTGALRGTDVRRGLRRAMDYLSSIATRRSMDYMSLLTEPVPVQHQEFGSERVTDFFARAQIFDITAGRDLRESLVVRRVDRSKDARAHVTVVRLPDALSALPRHRLWIEFSGDGAAFAVIVPAAPMTFRVKTIRREDRPLSIVSLRIDLGADLSPILDEAEGLLSRTGTVTADELVGLEQGLGVVKLDLPGAHLAAAMSAYLRVTFGAFTGIESEPYARFAEEPPSSDLFVIEIERLIRTDPTGSVLRCQQLAERVSRLGAPVLSSVETLLLGQIELFSRADLPFQWQDMSNILRDAFGGALAFHRGGGTFSTYAYTEEALTPSWEAARAVLQQRQFQTA